MSEKPANQVTTNADRVRSMSNKELADWHEKPCPGDMSLDCPADVRCKQCWFDWLNSPAESER